MESEVSVARFMELSVFKGFMNQIWTYGQIRAPTNLYFYIRILEWPDRGRG